MRPRLGNGGLTAGILARRECDESGQPSSEGKPLQQRGCIRANWMAMDCDGRGLLESDLSGREITALTLTLDVGQPLRNDHLSLCLEVGCSAQ